MASAHRRDRKSRRLKLWPTDFLPIFVEAAERPRGLTQLCQSLGFDLPDAFARDVELATDLFERVACWKPDPQPHPQDAFLARWQCGEGARRGWRSD